MPWYRGGYVSVTNGSTTVTGYGTLFTTNVKEGDAFFVSANKQDIYEIATVQDDHTLILHDPFLGASGTNVTYGVINNWNNTTSADLATQYAALLNAANARDAEIQTWLTGTVNGGPGGNGYYPIHDLAGNQQLIPCPALIRPPEDRAIQTNDGLFKLVQYTNPGYYQSLDLAAGSVHHVVLNQSSCELVFKNGNADNTLVQHICVILEQGTGSNTISPWPSNVRWNQSRLPILSYAVGQKDVIDFFSIDAGATWMGFFGGTQIPV